MPSVDLEDVAAVGRPAVVLAFDLEFDLAGHHRTVASVASAVAADTVPGGGTYAAVAQAAFDPSDRVASVAGVGQAEVVVP